ncbi:hypothetical protein ABES25_20975 [Bacillus gobiensis]|uniref:hypothetical protein n=1 Tax=Bacillus gobiensis TaxID=1441095 RepID=UPI003D1BA692
MKMVRKKGEEVVINCEMVAKISEAVAKTSVAVRIPRAKRIRCLRKSCRNRVRSNNFASGPKKSRRGRNNSRSGHKNQRSGFTARGEAPVPGWGRIISQVVRKKGKWSQ